MEKNEKEDAARAELVKIAEKTGVYFVIWYGHFGDYFCGMENGRSLKPEIYGAMYEMFYDVVKDDKKILKFEIEEPRSWKKVLDRVKREMF